MTVLQSLWFMLNQPSFKKNKFNSELSDNSSKKTL